LKVRFPIFYKLLVGFMLVTIIPLVVGSYYFYRYLENHLSSETVKNSVEITRKAGEEVQLHIQVIDQLLAYTASQYVTNRSGSQLLLWAYQLNPDIFRLVVVDSNNRVVESVSRYGYLGHGTPSPLATYALEVPDRKLLFFSHWQLEPQLVIVYPLVSVLDGRQHGCLLAEVSMKRFFNRFSRRGTGPGRTYLVNLAGRVVAHADFSLVLKGVNAGHCPPVARVLAGKSEAQGRYRDFSGRQVFGVAARVAGVPLVVVSEMPLQVAFALVEQVSRSFALVLLGTLLLLFLGCWLLSRSFTRPIGRLYRAAEKIRQGRFEALDGDFPPDEIGFFAQCFNQMIEALKADRELRERAEQELRESEKRYRMVADYAYDMECWRDTDGSFIHVSPSCREITGYSAEEFYANPGLMNEIVIDEDRPGFIDHRHEVDHDGSFKPIEFRIRHKDGSIRWLNHICQPVIGSDGENLGVRGSNRDVTVRKQAEIALAIEKERLLVTLRSIGDGVITTDNQGLVTMLNPVAEQLTGWRHHEAVGQPIAEVYKLIHERTRKPLVNPATRALEENRIVEPAGHSLLRARDGAEFAVADSAAPIVDNNGEHYGVVLVFRNVQDEKQLQVERLRAGKLEAVGLLAGGIAHDFNNLLMGLQGSLDLIRLTACEEEPEAVLRHVAKAETAVGRAVSLTRQFLTFAKGGSPVRERADLPSLVRESAEFVLHGSQVKLECDFFLPVSEVEIDGGQISQVVNNLVTNARQAMDDAGLVRIEIADVELDAEAAHRYGLVPGGYVRVAVIDHGPGIDPGLIDKVFEPYFTTKERGSGLGLATSYSIISSHGGYLGVASRPGHGSEFYFLLAGSGRPGAAAAARPEVAADRPADLFAGKRILVMDDEELIREVVTDILTLLGFEVVCVVDGEELLEVFQAGRSRGENFDVVLLDLSIPGGMGGQEAIRRLREIAPEIKAVVSSGYSQDPVMADFRSYGFDGVVAKPYRIDFLAETLRQLLTG
jgi:PAS domain S-box-containing protein